MFFAHPMRNLTQTVGTSRPHRLHIPQMLGVSLSLRSSSRRDSKETGELEVVPGETVGRDRTEERESH